MPEGRVIRVGVVGAAGRMGRCLLKTLLETDGYELVMAVGGRDSLGEDVAALLGQANPTGIRLESNLSTALAHAKPDVVVELTVPKAVYTNTRIVLEAGLPCVVGATGLTEAQLSDLDKLATLKGVGVLIAPNFALGVVLMMKMSQEAAKYFSHVEIIERHHEKKLDAPSGTAARTAEMMTEERARFNEALPKDAHETIAGSRGGKTDSGIAIHSLRLPGSLAHQQVLFGGVGETLTIQHDTLDRTAFMGGILLAAKQIRSRKGLFVGLETMMD
jgi:4-hydroxy-tetrahydrodipicolinate reductase